ncbi:magnesium transporter CorA family protein [Kineobactrum salinum]|uniref:Magnesium transporter CorA family protein n=1 Tax=Kineobactrum salinum TaxID=2708301 RepID=A0A6C0TXT1_9GAMM|nr:magnesium transporter CorA family protein [Kineobactrum salinum]QIB64448.1 magnesium transporter CorA family protein [Kineobactrum salinum]
MIRARLLTANGECQQGDEALLAPWREQQDSHLWLDIESELTEELQTLLLSLHCDKLALSDCSRPRHPPKVEEFEHNTFILFRGIASIDEQLSLQSQQVSVWVGERLLITMHSGHSVSVENFWESGTEQQLVRTPNILALRLLHYATGRYLEQIMLFDDQLADLEDALLQDSTDVTMKELVVYRSRLRKLRRIFNYHQRVAEQILHDGSPHLGSGRDASYHTRRDLFDRCERVHNLCSMYYEICGDLVESHISITSHRLNNTMKILTIITAIFIPLGFLAGIYGMNFEYMPELQFRHGYFVLLGVMATLVLGMLALFRKVRWL